MRLVSSNRWQIYSPYLGLCLVARGAGESAVVATTCGSWADQLWDWQGLVILPYPSQYDWFVNADSGLRIAARGLGESRAVATTCGNWADQHWKKWHRRGVPSEAGCLAPRPGPHPFVRALRRAARAVRVQLGGGG